MPRRMATRSHILCLSIALGARRGLAHLIEGSPFAAFRHLGVTSAK